MTTFGISSYYLLLTILMLNQNVSSTEFPIEEFFKTATEDFTLTKDFDEQAKQVYFCKGTSKCCDCKEECMLSGTCCIDKFWNASNPIPISRYVDNFVKEYQKVNKRLKCVSSLPFAKGSRYSTQSFKMVATCSPEADAEDIRKCINDETLQNYERIPVFGTDRYLYKNSFCAKCNFINQYLPANVTLYCDDLLPQQYPPKDDSTIFDRYAGCQIEIQKHSTSYNPVSCNTRATSTVCIDQKMQTNCDMYKGNYERKRNLHCYVCLGNKYNPGVSLRRCSDASKRFSWLITISFARDSTIVQGNGETVSYCKKGEMYNFLDGTCEKAACAPGFRSDGTTCIKENKRVTFRDPGFIKCLTALNATLYVFVKTKSTTFNSSLFAEHFENDIHTINEEFELVQGSINTNPTYKRKQTLTYSDVVEMQDLLRNTSLKIWGWDVHIFIASSSVQELTPLYGFDLARHFPHGKLCANNKLLRLSSGNFTQSCHFQSMNTSQRIDHEHLSLFVKINIENEEATVYQCTQFYLNKSCHITAINSNYTFNNITRELSVYLKHKNKTLIYQPDDYLPKSDNTFYICSSKNPLQLKSPKKYSWEKYINDSDSYISLIFVSISALFEILFILTFIFNIELHTRGGSNVLVMVVLLLISDTLFLLIVITKGEPYIACKSFAIIMHWTLLSISIWGVVLAGDITYTLLSTRAKTSNQNMVRLTANKVAYSLLPCGMLVALCVSLDETNTLNFGYGDNGLCWIATFYPKLAFYLIPAVLAFLVSMTFLTSTLAHLYRQEKTQRKNLRKSGRADMDLATIAAKLIVVVGTAEVIGLIQIRKPDFSEDEKLVNAIFGLLYVVVRSIRGTMIYWLYLGNKKTWKFYRISFLKKEKMEEISLKTKVTSTPLLD